MFRNIKFISYTLSIYKTYLFFDLEPLKYIMIIIIFFNYTTKVEWKMKFSLAERYYKCKKGK